MGAVGPVFHPPRHLLGVTLDTLGLHRGKAPDHLQLIGFKRHGESLLLLLLSYGRNRKGQNKESDAKKFSPITLHHRNHLLFWVLKGFRRLVWAHGTGDNGK